MAMPYNESEIKAKIREIANESEVVFEGGSDQVACIELKKEHFHWLMNQANKVEKYEKALKKVEEAIDF
jgi:hypothetical protein